MTSLLDGLQSALGVFVRSDVYGPLPPRWYIVLTGNAAHVLIGAALAFFPVRAAMLAMVAGAWIAKEVLGDIPNSGGAALVYADSLPMPGTRAAVSCGPYWRRTFRWAGWTRRWNADGSSVFQNAVKTP